MPLDDRYDNALTTTAAATLLIGFSGDPGREAAQLVYTAQLLPHYGEDWWLLSVHAQALCETGQVDPALAMMERSLDLNNANANAAHFKAHALYEHGAAEAGLAYLADWISGYDRRALLHGHLKWHEALWTLGMGDRAGMWAIMDGAIAPGASQSLPINVLTDSAALLYRAEIAGGRQPGAARSAGVYPGQRALETWAGG
jgi:tetratricopeptide (TPR) repeat protein